MIWLDVMSRLHKVQSTNHSRTWPKRREWNVSYILLTRISFDIMLNHLNLNWIRVNAWLAKLSQCHPHSASRTIKIRSKTFEHIFILLPTHISYLFSSCIYMRIWLQFPDLYMPEYCISHRNTNLLLLLYFQKLFSCMCVNWVYFIGN